MAAEVQVEGKVRPREPNCSGEEKYSQTGERVFIVYLARMHELLNKVSPNVYTSLWLS